ncbi:GAF domain-containing protein [Actinoplanes solisilvae]|uniref:GAF domain-containing protein n=1 Tax=Actinoplanes solisilvae TaxID=2486853 RepID=UPI000FD73EE3|nr:GAF domain-containing protein [Actinoplanes solisilvae]
MIPESERAALLRLGVLAGTAPIQDLFDAIADELSNLVDLETGRTRQIMSGIGRFDADGMMTVVATRGTRPDWPGPVGSRWKLDGDSSNAQVYRTGRPSRMENGIEVNGSISRLLESLHATSSVAVPLFVDDRLWGSATVVSDQPAPLPANIESRLAEFAALASTAISSAQRREEVERLAREHAALRRVATLVARTAEPEKIWDVVLDELGELCDAPLSSLVRFESADAVTVIAARTPAGPVDGLPSRWPAAGNTISAKVAAQHAVVRIDWSGVEGAIGEIVRERTSLRTSIMAPVFDQGELWGGLAVHAPKEQFLAADTERRLAGFAELVSTALANATARAEVRRIAEEQATIRRIATLVARQAPPAEICQTVADALAALFEVEDMRLFRYDPGDEVTVVGSHGLMAGDYPVGSSHRLLAGTAVDLVRRDGVTTRLDGYDDIAGEPASAARTAGLRSTVACPVFVGDRLWGALAMASLQPGRIPDRVLPPISDCVDLIATAIHNAEAEERLLASRARIVAATDEARRRFERDLHDGAQQRLVSLSLELRATETLAGEALRTATHELDAILTDLRDLSRGLHPAMLSEGGLPSAVRSLVRRCPTPVRLVLPDTWANVSEVAEIACYYVVAEALTNVAKHASASAVDLELTLDDQGVRVTVADDGVGGVDTGAGSGVIGIADRLETLGGSLSVISPPGGGTTLVAKLPAARVASTLNTCPFG